MDTTAVDQVQLSFDPQSLRLINAVIGLMMFGMALDIKIKDFSDVVTSPKGPAIGLAAQFLLLPALTFLLTLVLPISPSMALGMMLVAACPGGNLSNVMTYLAKGNAALSVSMTAVSTAAAVVMTPLNLTIWGNLNPSTAAIMREVSLSPLDVLSTIVLILGLPLAAGLTVGRYLPKLVHKVRRPFKVFSIVVFLAVVALALRANWEHFINHVGLVALFVFVHNAVALALGYGSARLAKLPPRDARAVSIEVGIQNSALALVLTFSFFDGLGGMAIIAGWWGIWHIISGLTVATLFSAMATRDRAPEEVSP